MKDPDELARVLDDDDDDDEEDATLPKAGGSGSGNGPSGVSNGSEWRE